MNNNAPTGREVSHDVVAGQWVATLRVAYDHALGTGDYQACYISLVFAVLVGTREETRRQRRESLAKTELFEKLRRVVEAKFIECLGHAHLAHFAQR